MSHKFKPEEICKAQCAAILAKKKGWTFGQAYCYMILHRHFVSLQQSLAQAKAVGVDPKASGIEEVYTDFAAVLDCLGNTDMFCDIEMLLGVTARREREAFQKEASVFAAFIEDMTQLDDLKPPSRWQGW